MVNQVIEFISKAILAIRFLWKILILKMIGIGSVKIDGISLAGKYSKIECAKDAVLSISSKVCLSAGSLLAVRKSAKISLGDNVFINRNCVIVSHHSIIIERGVTIGPNCCIYDHDHDLKNRGKFISSPIFIEENVWIGANVLILKGVKIGKNSVIAAGCVITHDIPSNTIVIQKRNNCYYEVLNNINNKK